MYKIKSLNQISIKGLDRFSREKYEVSSDIGPRRGVAAQS